MNAEDTKTLADYIRSAKTVACKQRKRRTVERVLRAAGWDATRVRQFVDSIK